MKPVLVTGASGFLGWHVASLLVERGMRVRALARRAGSIRDLDAEIVQGDLRNPGSLQRAAASCGAVFHVAADYRLWVKEPREMYEANVDGTRALIQASEAAGVERFVYTSTVGCIGFVPGGLGDETTPVSLAAMTGHYKRSKFLAEQEALKAAQGGFPLVIVNPTAPVGAHDVKPTPTGQTILDFLRGRMPAFIDTGLNVVDAGDVAQGHWLAFERGRTGERYILGGENLTLEQILQELASITSRPAPSTKLPWPVAWLAGAVSTAVSQITGKAPRVPLDAVRMARKKMWVSHGKAAGELGYAPQPAHAGLANAVRWFQAHGYC
jgi:dihydroflavonol-4-reductase